MFKRILCLCILSFSVAACSDSAPTPSKNSSAYPQDSERTRKESRGKLTGDGLTLGGEDNKDQNSPIGVNAFLWQAALDTLSFLPLVSADPFGGVLITDWYEDPKTPGERFKVNTLILGRTLRADAVKVSVFKQLREDNGTWRDAPVNSSVGRDLEDTILTRARQLRVKQISE